MTKMTPEKLVQEAEYADLDGESRFANIMLAAVGPWKAALSRLEAAEARIGALEKVRSLAMSEWSTWKDILMSNMTEVD